VACDSYHLYEEDVKLLKGLGVSAYRFSVSWPRILPDGVGKVDPEGIAYYQRLARLLVDNGITPCVTLYHWDLPLALSLKGGLLNREFADWFLEYTKVVVDCFGDDVELYFTFNEPESIVGAGYALGAFAPGIAMRDWAFPALHHMLLAHGKAAAYLKSKGKQVGFVGSGETPYPATDSPENIAAAKEELFACKELWSISNYFDPIFLGDYSEAFYKKYGDIARRFIREGDMQTICGNTDLCCMNHYNGYPVYRAEDGSIVRAKRPCGSPMTAAGWAIDEKGVYPLFQMLGERYHKPMMLTENGLSTRDAPLADGRVRDYARIDYLAAYLKEVERCVKDGIDLRGYFVWSLLDNFEWLCGYTQRFGLVYVDFQTQKRTPKESYFFYSDYISKH
jgi:beta-glucosidase